MIKKTMIVANKSGLHARPASRFVRVAKQFNSKIIISRGEETANAKSMISVLGLGVDSGTRLDVQVSGEDEQQAMDAITKVIKELIEE